MAVQRTQNNKSGIFSNIGVLLALLIAYVIFSFAAGLVFSTFIQSYFLAYALSFASVGLGFYVALHLVIPSDMVQVDTRLLHELAKRRLVEFETVDDRQISPE